MRSTIAPRIVPLEEAHYHVGHNMPGYLPESEPWSTNGIDEAVSALEAQLEEFQDSIGENCENGGISPEHPDSDRCDCDWCDIWVEIGATLSSIHDGDLKCRILNEGGNLNVYYFPQEGPNSVYWVNVVTHTDDEPCQLDED